MNQDSPVPEAKGSPSRPPTRRTLAKQQTRLRVLAAARRLFSEEGYEGATIRDIAAAAGMSTGAVFANFTDKADLFREIMGEDLTALLAAMREAASKGQGVEDALVGAFMAGYGFYQSRLQLARAALSVSWDREGGISLRSESGMAFATIFDDILSVADGRGELVEGVKIPVLGQVLYATYVANYRQAIFEHWTLEALAARSRAQISVLMAGSRKG